MSDRDCENCKHKISNDGQIVFHEYSNPLDDDEMQELTIDQVLEKIIEEAK